MIKMYIFSFVIFIISLDGWCNMLSAIQEFTKLN
jgi:hypothetical protein